MSDEQDVGTRFSASSNQKLIEISPTINEHELFAVNAASCELDAEGRCITCSDEAVTVQVLRIDSETGIALVTVQDKTEEVDITLVEDVVPGDWLLVHGGVAISNAANAAGAQFTASAFPNDSGEANDA
ncbi:MAG TPA: HypC/HybG/HupF family hydrogenase formation chaperone [Ktedonobacteraceae bacterium]|nr:HypC/HybG/HupF family hydrogenase formation chaperone [Ktedonobacteraceae bacterium]